MNNFDTIFDSLPETMQAAIVMAIFSKDKKIVNYESYLAPYYYIPEFNQIINDKDNIVKLKKTVKFKSILDKIQKVYVPFENLCEEIRKIPEVRPFFCDIIFTGNQYGLNIMKKFLNKEQFSFLENIIYNKNPFDVVLNTYRILNWINLHDDFSDKNLILEKFLGYYTDLQYFEKICFLNMYFEELDPSIIKSRMNSFNFDYKKIESLKTNITLTNTLNRYGITNCSSDLFNNVKISLNQLLCLDFLLFEIRADKYIILKNKIDKLIFDILEGIFSNHTKKFLKYTLASDYYDFLTTLYPECKEQLDEIIYEKNVSDTMQEESIKKKY